VYFRFHQETENKNKKILINPVDPVKKVVLKLESIPKYILLLYASERSSETDT
jgi:hypothetical protein